MHRNSLLLAALISTAATGMAISPFSRSTVSTVQGPELSRVLPPVKSMAVSQTELQSLTPGPQFRAQASANAYSIPFSMAPTAEQLANECVVIDANHDAYDIYNTWCYSDYFDTVIYWAQKNNDFDSKLDADDWLIFPVINFTDATKVYRVSIDAHASTDLTFESMELRIGKTPTVEGLSRVILSEPVVDFNNMKMRTYSSLFALPEAGEYYIALRCNSSAQNGWRLFAQNLKVEATDLSAEIPNQVDGLSATPDATGKMKADVNFTMPTTALNGKQLSAGQTLTAKVTSPAGTKTVTGTPGQKMSLQIDTNEGINAITVTVSNNAGEGISSSTSVKCGLDAPVAAVLRTSISDDNLTLTVSWDPVTTGINGGMVDPESVKYTIFRYNASSDSWSEIATDITETHYVISVPAGTPLGYCDIAVDAHNEKGGAEQIPTVSELIGDPYKLPLNETLEGQQQHYVGLTIDSPTTEYNARFGSVDPTQLDEAFANPNNAALVGMSQDAKGTRGKISLPKFSTIGLDRIQIILPIFLFSGTPEITVLAKTNTGEPIELGKVDITAGSGWTNLPFILPAELYGKQCVTVSLDMKFDNMYQTFLMEGYNIKESLKSDFAVSNIVVSPDPIAPGKPATVTVTVSNEGMDAINPPALTGRLTARGTQIMPLTFTPASTEMIPMNGSTTYTAEFTLTTADYVGSTINISASIDTPDENPANDSNVIQANVGYVETPIITDLTAEFIEESGAIALKWSSPVSDEGFEDCEFLPTFSYDSSIGVWRNLDFDGLAPYTMGEVEGVSIPNDTEPKAFMVISAEESGLGQVDIYGNNGSDKFLMAFSPQEGAADDWLISPEVMGGSEVSFAWDIITSDYTEKIEILYSTTDQDPDSFKNKIDTYTKEQVGWEEILITLPEEAKYFAIRYCSYNCFGIMIDDITYYPVTAEYEIASYELLRDDQPLTTLEATATSYLDTTTELNKYYTYHVVPTYNHNGTTVKGLRSNTVSLAAAGIGDIMPVSASVYGVKGGINILGHEGETLYICNMQGQILKEITVTSATHFETMPAGMYLIGSNKVVVK